MRPLTATLGVLALAGGLLGVSLCGCADPGGLKVSGPAQSPSVTSGPVFVAQAGPKPRLRRPESFDIGKDVTLTGLRWRTWGGPTAEATGEVAGARCAPACRDKPVKAEITFTGLVRHDRVGYYSRATVSARGLPPEQREELRDLRLLVPQG
ncbi:hypothetical protein ACH4U6_18355 [Streptomyces netropsis]|uniref:hypothetical protein n=1 Tax=Streptomyces netropsis TaxID=55404 RepID=UPI0037999FF8